MTTKAAIVTGAAGGIGKAISKVLLKKGYKVGGKIIFSNHYDCNFSFVYLFISDF